MQLVLFAKWPQPGKVKTRLLPLFDPHTSARFATELIHWTIDRVSKSNFERATLAVWPVEFVDCANETFSVSTIPQIEGNLGDKMAHVICQGITQKKSSIILGCDVPHISIDVLNKAYSEFSSGNDIIGPTEDGGFYLIGLHQFDPLVFNSVEWGGSNVLRQVIDNYHACGFNRLQKLPMLRDLDEPEDVMVVANNFTPIAQFLTTVSNLSSAEVFSNS